jgi:hypothetical protein
MTNKLKELVKRLNKQLGVINNSEYQFLKCVHIDLLKDCKTELQRLSPYQDYTWEDVAMLVEKVKLFEAKNADNKEIWIRYSKGNLIDLVNYLLKKYNEQYQENHILQQSLDHTKGFSDGLIAELQEKVKRLEAENVKLLDMIKELIDYVDDDVHQEDLPECYYLAKTLLKQPPEGV